MVASSNAEAGHASNEYAVPTQLLGILTIEKQILKLLEQDNGWIQCDITEHQELELHRLSKKDDYEINSGSAKALFNPTCWSFNKFENNLKGSLYYTKVPVYDGDKHIGNNIICKDEDPGSSIFIPNGGRCLLLECIAMDNQCCHELANDDAAFILEKWSTRYWCDDTYHSCYGDYGFHVSTNSVGMERISDTNDANIGTFVGDVGNGSKSNVNDILEGVKGNDEDPDAYKEGAPDE